MKVPPHMSTYLIVIALAIQDFSSQAAQGGSNMTIWATEEYIQVEADYRRCQMVVFTASPHPQAGYADYAAEVGPQCVARVEELYSVPYTLAKMDMIHVNNLGSAMENWGLITYDFDYLLYDATLPDPDSDRKCVVIDMRRYARCVDIYRYTV